MRIVGGEFRGRRIAVPSNFPSRPTTDFAKEGLFNVLDHTIDLSEIRILDLCTGTGNIALEFISRGVSTVTCVDIHVNCLKFVKKNAESLGVSSKIETRKLDIISFLKTSDEKFDLVFADPPYAYPNYNELIESVFKFESLQNDGLFVLEHSKQKSFQDNAKFMFYKNYGNVSFSFFKQSKI